MAAFSKLPEKTLKPPSEAAIAKGRRPHLMTNAAENRCLICFARCLGDYCPACLQLDRIIDQYIPRPLHDLEKFHATRLDAMCARLPKTPLTERPLVSPGLLNLTISIIFAAAVVYAVAYLWVRP